MVLITEWMQGGELVECGKLEIGDLIVFQRGFPAILFNHWGVYIGFHNGVPSIAHMSADGGSDATIEMEEVLPNGGPDETIEMAVELLNSSQKCSVKTLNVSGVRIDPVVAVAKTDNCMILNQLDKKYRTFPPIKIIERAFLVLERGTGGNRTIEKNFAKWCRYGSRALNEEWADKRYDFIANGVAVGAGIGVSFVTANPAVFETVYAGTLAAIGSVCLTKAIIQDPASFYGLGNIMKTNINRDITNIKEHFNDKFY